ncbi:unnamed protein product [Ostreobium quekettii]|uniref:Uncharacterized protein n=1 Tax=Ostreobium quekettii TaxID=121088 RepID=A0A8S1J7L1_9CHLO|nr:unnamed protein product [Ostreobium quekettii]|eukprot:evm.model.scf_1182.6 EVM.evm.TU.scf_1182.6   scf_1182:30195-31328(+)
MAEDQCYLLRGVASYVAQVCLLVFVLLSLAYKRHCESPKRPVKVWALDVGKQAVSAGFSHLCNMAIAKYVAKSASPCAWYFLVFTIDTTLGVSLAVLIHRLFIHGAKRLQRRHRFQHLSDSDNSVGAFEHWWDSIAKCGNYGDPPSLITWSWQMAEWTLATIIARAFCAWLIVVTRGGGSQVARLLDHAFEGHPDWELFFVMVMCPIGMNLAQAWIQDAVLKRRKEVAQNSQIELDGMKLLDRNWGKGQTSMGSQSDGSSLQWKYRPLE